MKRNYETLDSGKAKAFIIEVKYGHVVQKGWVRGPYPKSLTYPHAYDRIVNFLLIRIMSEIDLQLLVSICPSMGLGLAWSEHILSFQTFYFHTLMGLSDQI